MEVSKVFLQCENGNHDRCPVVMVKQPEVRPVPFDTRLRDRHRPKGVVTVECGCTCGHK